MRLLYHAEVSLEIPKYVYRRLFRSPHLVMLLCVFHLFWSVYKQQGGFLGFTLIGCLICGRVDTEDILTRVFATFCLGK